MFTPRFGEITEYDDIITETVYKNIRDELKLDNSVWFILYKRSEYSKCVMGCATINQEPYTNICLIDNYLNKYIFDIGLREQSWTKNILKELNDVNEYYKINNKKVFIESVFKELKRDCKYDTPLSDEEIKYIQEYCNESDIEDISILKNKMKAHITLQETINTYSNNIYILEDKCRYLLNQNELFKEANKSLEEKLNALEKQNKLLIANLESSFKELQTKQNEDSTFMKYLKNLFVWN